MTRRFGIAALAILAFVGLTRALEAGPLNQLVPWQAISSADGGQQAVVTTTAPGAADPGLAVRMAGGQLPAALDGTGGVKVHEQGEPSGVQTSREIRRSLERLVLLQRATVLLLMQIKDPGAATAIDGLDDALRDSP